MLYISRGKESIIKRGRKKNNMLTPKQERYVEELVKGKSQREAYRIAYPKSQSWKDSAVDSQACRLLKNSKVNSRYQELMEESKTKGGNDATTMRAFIIEQLTKIATGEGQDTSEVYDAEGNLLQSRKGSRQTDRINALKELAEIYGIGSVEEKDAIKIIVENADEYKG